MSVENVVINLTSDCEWTTRITALQRLEGLVIGGVEHHEAIPGVLKLLIGPLGVQLADRRSAVVKQVCHLLTVFGEELESAFETSAEVFIPALLKLVVVTVLVIAESAHRCIRTLVLHCRVARLAPRFLETCLHDRSPILRTRCAEYAVLVLEQWGQHPEVARHADHYELFVKNGVKDAVGEVRATARRCYAHFATLWPERAAKLGAGFDPATQKLLTSDTGSRPLLRSRAVLAPVSSNIMREKPRPLPSSAFKPSRPRQLPTLATAGGKLQGCGDGLLPPVRTAGLTLESELRCLPPLPTAGLWNPARRKRHSVSGALRIRAAAPPEHKLPPPTAPIPTPWSALKPQRLEPLLTAGFHLAPKLTEALKEEAWDGKQSLNKSRGYRRSMGGAMLSAEVKPAGAWQGGAHQYWLRSGAKRVLLEPVAEKTQVRPENEESPEPQASGEERGGREEKGGREAAVEGGEAAEALPGLADALREGLRADADWSIRVKAFEALQEPGGVPEMSQNLVAVVRLLALHLDDHHFKVAHSALKAFTALLPHFRTALAPHLDEFLVPVLGRLVDLKPQTRQVAGAAAAQACASFGGQAMAAPTLRALESHKSPKARATLLAFVAKVLPCKATAEGEGVTLSGSGLKVWVCKVGGLACDKNAQLKEAAVRALASTYTNVDAAAIVSYVNGVPAQEQRILRKLLAPSIPELESQLLKLSMKPSRTRKVAS